MGQHRIPHNPKASEKEAILTNLDAQISRLDSKIAALTKEKSTLEHTRAYILPNTVSNESKSSLHNGAFSAHYSAAPQNAFNSINSKESTVQPPPPSHTPTCTPS